MPERCGCCVARACVRVSARCVPTGQAIHEYHPKRKREEALLDQARTGLERLYTALYRVQEITAQAPSEARSGRLSFIDKFDAALEDDFNTPSAIAALFDIVKGINRAIESGESASARRLASELQQLASRLGSHWVHALATPSALASL